MARGRSASRALWVAAGAVSIVGICLVAAGVFAAWQSCKLENSDCARPPTRDWRGRVFTADGRPASHATVRYGFESARPRAVVVSTDAAGRYCVRWPHEAATPEVVATRVRSSAPVDPRFRGGRARAPRLVSPDAVPTILRGPVAMSSRLWRPSKDAATECQDVRGPPWYRVEGLTATWRLSLVRYIAFACILWPLAVLVAPRSRRAAVARSGTVLALIDALLFILVWVTKTI